MKKIRVLVVDDSFFMRRLISDMLLENESIDVIDTAKNGLEAIEKTLNLSPDIVTLDIEMPIMDGLEALQKIMTQHPVPIIMLSSLTKQGADTTIKALHFGAFDFIQKPSGAISFDIENIKNELIDKVLIANSQKKQFLKQWKFSNKASFNVKPNNKVDFIYPAIKNDSYNGIVAIGASTGGPKALQEVITSIPKNFPYPILIVQHMPAGFTNSLANRLNSLSEISVVEASDNELIEPGNVYLAPGDYHMEVKENKNKLYINLNQKDTVGGHRPSVDTLFASLTGISFKKIFVIMTGMGSDGTKGLLEAKKIGDISIAQDEKTCVVYGMPRAAIQSGLIDITAPLYQISDKILSSVQ